MLTCTVVIFSLFLSLCLVSLMDKVGLHKNSCKVIDVTNKRGTVQTLTETKISCSLDEKVSCSIFIIRLWVFPCFSWDSEAFKIWVKIAFCQEPQHTVWRKRKIRRQFSCEFTWFVCFTIPKKN